MNKCVLIFDDDAEILMVCKIILEQKNYIVQTRLFCDDIIKDIKDVNPDVILMDLWIPTIGGEKAVNLIKTDATYMHIPVILFSANAEIDIIEERAKANGVLKKPFDVNTLLLTIENTLAGVNL
ncbi:MAG TPA: response regulator [Ginsengibacter sp.]